MHHDLCSNTYSKVCCKFFQFSTILLHEIVNVLQHFQIHVTKKRGEVGGESTLQLLPVNLMYQLLRAVESEVKPLPTRTLSFVLENQIAFVRSIRRG